MSGRDPYAPVIDASERDMQEARSRGGRAAKGEQAHGGRGWKSGSDVYHRVRDIRAEVAAEDKKRGRCTW